MLTPDARQDPSLPTVGLAGAPGVLGEAESPLVLAGPAGSGPFLLEGSRVSVRGRERPGASSVFVDGRRVAGDLRTDAGAGVNVVVGPASLRRELLGPRGSLVEHTLALPTLPLVAVQWTAPPGGRALSGLEVSFTLLPDAPAVRYRASGDAVRAVEADGGPAVEAVVHPAPTSWTVVEAGGGGVRATACIENAHLVTLLLAAGSGEEVAGALAAAAHLAAHEQKVARASDPGRSATLTLETGVRELDHGVAWAAVRLEAALKRRGRADASSAFWSGVGALAAGDPATAEAALRLLEQAPGEEVVALGWGAPAPAGALALLTAARLTLLTGDPEPAVARTPAQEALQARHAASSGDAWPWWSLALATLADALRWAAPDHVIQEIRAVAARPPAGGGGVRLPMLGGHAGPQGPGLLASLLRLGGSVDAPDASPSEVPPVLEAWTRFVAHRPDEGYASWRAGLAHGLEGGPTGRGSWEDAPLDDARPALPGASGAGLLLATLAHGLLGFAPDAPAGRLGLAPAVPGHVKRFTARNLRVGTALLGLSYLREGGVHHFRLEPHGGGVPPMVVFEPSVAGAPVAGVEVDGAAAELDARPAGPGRTGVRIQIPVDEPRTVAVACG